MRTLPEIIADLDTVLKACIKEKCGISDIIIALAALTAELKDYAESTITSHDTLYYCDPEKNTECPKTNCHINGGDCRLTTHRKYRRKK